MTDLYKLVVRDKNGQVQQIHELYSGPLDESHNIEDIILEECDKNFSVTITKMYPDTARTLETCGRASMR